MTGEHLEGLVAIGASSGGPPALAKLLADLPENFSASIVIVQHIDEQFADGMAEWLGQHTAWPVRVVKEGDSLAPGTIWLSNAGDHLVLKTVHRLGYVSEPADSAHRPSIDVFFDSVKRLWRGRMVGILLTGMGSDGAAGLKALRAKGHYTIAQDARSSAVYGMPKAAVAIDAAVDVLPLDKIAPKLLEKFPV